MNESHDDEGVCLAASERTLFLFKGRAQRHRANAPRPGITHSQALEMVAAEEGFRDWNGLHAHVRAGGIVDGNKPLFPWQEVDKVLPALPHRFSSLRDYGKPRDCPELMRWARQLDLIATKVAVEDRAEMVSLIGTLRPYVLERKISRWKDDLFHLCARSYQEFDGMTLSCEQIEALGIPSWHERHPHHDGKDAFTLLADGWNDVSDSTVLKQMARLIASIAMEINRTQFTDESIITGP